MIQLLKPSDYRRQPWKNGGGVTDEIAADAENDPPAWRISVATIERDGPFSDFRGYDRTIVALDSGVTLTIDGNDVELLQFEPHDFRGESKAGARVRATSRDLNAMTMRALYAHDIEVIRSPQRFLVDDDELLFVYILCGSAMVNDVACVANETVYLDSVERFDVRPGADSAACVIHITPR